LPDKPRLINGGEAAVPPFKWPSFRQTLVVGFSNVKHAQRLKARTVWTFANIVRPPLYTGLAYLDAQIYIRRN
jgi:hypothetical protein